MKRFWLVFLVCFSLVPVSHSAIDKIDVETKLIDSLRQIRAAALSARTSLTSLNGRMFDLGAGYGESIDSKDKTSLGKLPAKIQDAIDSLNVVINSIDADYPSIQG